MAQELAGAEFIGLAASPTTVSVDMLFVPVFEGDDALEDLPGLDAATGGDITRARESSEFRARLFELFIARVTEGPWQAVRVALVGAGRREDADAERLRRIAAACSYTARMRSMRSAAFVVRAGLDPVRGAEIGADGMSAAEFDAGTYKSEPDAGVFPERIVIVSPQAQPAALADAVFRGRTLGASANVARALANEPSNILPPRVFAERVDRTSVV